MELIYDLIKYAQGSDGAFIRQIDYHSGTERALFNNIQVKRFLSLALVPKHKWDHLSDEGFTAMHKDAIFGLLEKAKDQLYIDRDLAGFIHIYKVRKMQRLLCISDFVDGDFSDMSYLNRQLCILYLFGLKTVPDVLYEQMDTLGL